MKKLNLTLANFDQTDKESLVYLDKKNYGFNIWLTADDEYRVSKYYGENNDGGILEESIGGAYESTSDAIDYINAKGFDCEIEFNEARVDKKGNLSHKVIFRS